MKKYFGFILVIVVMQAAGMENEQAADLASNGILVIDELDFSDAHGRLISIEQMVSLAQQAKLPDSFDVNDMQATLEATPVQQYNALCARVIRKSKKSGNSRLMVTQFLSEFIEIQKEMLREAKEGGKIQEAAYQQQVQSATFARRSAYGATAFSTLTFIWGAISTYFAANPDCATSSLLVNSTDLIG